MFRHVQMSHWILTMLHNPHFIHLMASSIQHQYAMRAVADANTFSFLSHSWKYYTYCKLKFSGLSETRQQRKPRLVAMAAVPVPRSVQEVEVQWLVWPWPMEVMMVTRPPLDTLHTQSMESWEFINSKMLMPTFRVERGRLKVRNEWRIIYLN